MGINWDWYLKSACELFDADDKQFDVNLEGLKSDAGNKYIELEKDSPDYLFAKYRNRIISMAYVKAALFLTHNENGIDEDEFDDWSNNLWLIAVFGNPNKHFTIPSKSIEYIGSENLKEPVERFGKEEMASFIDDSVKIVTFHLRTVSEKGEGRNVEVGNALINLYFSCFESFINGELDDFDLTLSRVSLQFRGQTNFAKDLIKAYQNEESIHEELEDEELEDEAVNENSEKEHIDNLDEDVDDEAEYSQEELDELSAIIVSGGEEQLAALESMTKAEIKEWADVYKFNVPLSLSKAKMIKRFIEETEYLKEEDDKMFAILDSGGEEQLEALESMTKAEIKEWADAYKYNVPLSLSKSEMIKRFIKEADENYESEHEFSTSTDYYILCFFGGFLLGALFTQVLDYLLL